MTRILLIAAFVCLAARADSAAEVFDLIVSMAAGLSENNAPAFAAALSESMDGRSRLMTDVRGMLEQSEVTSAIERIGDEGDDVRRTVVLDWTLHMKRRGNDVRSEDRREAVTAVVGREGAKWRVTSITPTVFFAPPEFR